MKRLNSWLHHPHIWLVMAMNIYEHESSSQCFLEGHLQFLNVSKTLSCSKAENHLVFFQGRKLTTLIKIK